jgi:hypothetical protein
MKIGEPQTVAQLGSPHPHNPEPYLLGGCTFLAIYDHLLKAE